VDKTLRLWDAKSGQPIGGALQGHGDLVFSVAFSPDGARIVSGSVDKTLRFWDAKNGQPIGAPLQGHENAVLSVAFSSDGTRIVSASADKTLRLWNAENRQPIGAPLRVMGIRFGVWPLAPTARVLSREVPTTRCGSGMPAVDNPSAHRSKAMRVG
jgi:WD40 repeat protein